MLGIGPADPAPPKQVGLVRAGVNAIAVEHLTDLDASTKQLGASGLDVGDYEIEALSGAGCRRGYILAEDDRAPRARRRELDHSEVVIVGVVCIEPPSEPGVELLGTINIRDRKDDDLELHIDYRCFSLAARVFDRDWLGTHGCLLRCRDDSRAFTIPPRIVRCVWRLRADARLFERATSAREERRD